MKQLLCPISMDVLKDPYFLQCGHVFEKNYILSHFKFNNNKCPICMQEQFAAPKKLYL
ncbi:MAG: U-box domain-containing protein [bacterium]